MQRGQEPQRVDVTIGIIATKNTEITGGDLKEGDRIIIGENNLKSTGTMSMTPPRGGRGGPRRR